MLAVNHVEETRVAMEAVKLYIKYILKGNKAELTKLVEKGDLEELRLESVKILRLMTRLDFLPQDMTITPEQIRFAMKAVVNEVDEPFNYTDYEKAGYSLR